MLTLVMAHPTARKPAANLFPWRCWHKGHLVAQLHTAPITWEVHATTHEMVMVHNSMDLALWQRHLQQAELTKPHFPLIWLNLLHPLFAMWISDVQIKASLLLRHSTSRGSPIHSPVTCFPQTCRNTSLFEIFTLSLNLVEIGQWIQKLLDTHIHPQRRCDHTRLISLGY